MARHRVSERETALPYLTIGKLLTIAAEDKSVISLGPGEPDFETPPHIINAAQQALKDRETHYAPVGGRSDFKEAIIRKLKRDNRIVATPENIIVTTGSTEGILLSLLCSIDPGEGVLLPDPGFLAYRPTVELLNGMPLPVSLRYEDGFQLTTEHMEQAILPEKTNVLILNTPSNPTGTVLTRQTLEEIADFVTQHDLLVIADEAYEKLVYDATHLSIGSLNGMEDRVVTLHTFSKACAMAGFRVGYAAGPERLIAAMHKVHLLTTLSTPTISQIAAMEALTGSQAAVQKMVKEYDRRRKLIVRRLREMGRFECLEPQGAFYVFPKIPPVKKTALAFSEWLLREAKVMVVPGTEFGRRGEGFIRLSYATGADRIQTAMDRIEKAVGRWR